MAISKTIKMETRDEDALASAGGEIIAIRFSPSVPASLALGDWVL